MKSYVLLVIGLQCCVLHYAASQWTSDFSLNTQVSPFGVSPIVTSDGDGGAIVFFSTLGSTRSYIQRIDKNGFVRWNNGSPVRVGGFLKNQGTSAICPDGNGGAYLQYIETDKTNPPDTGRTLVFTNRIDSNGTLLWNGSIGLDLGYELFSGNQPWRFNDYDVPLYKMVSSTGNGYYFTWADSTHPAGVNNTSLKIQRYNPDGSKAFGHNGFIVTTDVPFDTPIDICDDNNGGVYVSTVYKVYHLDSNGYHVFPDSGVYLARGTNYLELNRDDNVLICPSIEPIGLTNISKYYLTTINSQGSVLWEKLIIDSIKVSTARPTISITSTGEINIFWKKQYADSSHCILWMHLDKNGVAKYNLPTVVINNTVTIGDYIPIVNRFNTTLILWGQAGIHFYAQKIDSIGLRIWDKPIILNSKRTNDRLHAVPQGDQGAIIVWYGIGEQNGVFAQNINVNGTLGPLTVERNRYFEKASANNFSFVGNYPNPFNPSTNIVFELPYYGTVKIVVYDSIGREITKKEEYFTTGGRHSLQFEERNLSSGLYFCSIRFNEQVVTKKMMVLK